jgi:hypothetical protein
MSVRTGLSNGKELVANKLALLRDLAVHRRQASWLALCSVPVEADAGKRLVSGLDGLRLRGGNTICRGERCPSPIALAGKQPGPDASTARQPNPLPYTWSARWMTRRTKVMPCKVPPMGPLRYAYTGADRAAA